MIDLVYNLCGGGNMNIKKNEEEKAINRTFSMKRDMFKLLEKQAKEKHLTNSGYIQYLILREEDKKNDRER